MDEIKSQLKAEIKYELERLEDAETGSDEYKVTVDGLVKLVDRAIELEKIDVESVEKEKDRKFDEKLKTEQAKDNRTDQLIRNGIAIAGIVVPTAVTIWGTLKTLKFEETGTVTTIMGRGFINKLIPKK